MNFEIFELVECDERFVEPIQALLTQLTSSPVDFTFEALRALVGASNTHLFLLQCDGAVRGMLTLADYITPTGRKMWVEDVVVDAAVRGRALGRCLVEHAIAVARERGGTLMLTSKPSRVAANALYRSAGFEQKETNVYKMDC